MKTENMVGEMEIDYKMHKKALEISNSKFNALEKKRSYFWQVVGDPPILKPFKKLLYSEWAPVTLVCVLFVGWVLAMSLAQSIGLMVMGFGLCVLIGVIKKHDNRRYQMSRKEIRKWKHNFFHNRN